MQPPLEPFYTNESDLKESDIPTTKTEGRGVVLAATINKFNAATVKYYRSKKIVIPPTLL